MKKPQHRPGQAFETASDKDAAWRAQQIAALTAEQSRAFEAARNKAAQDEKAKVKQLALRRQADIKERMRKLLLAKAQLQFKYKGRSATMSEILAKRLVAQHFLGATPPDANIGILLREAGQQAAREIAREHGIEENNFRHQTRERLDHMLRGFEHAHGADSSLRPDFGRTAATGKARTDFQKAARDDPSSEARKPGHSDALARAIEKARRQEASRERDSRSKGDDGRTRE